jgi:hypothetical protein
MKYAVEMGSGAVICKSHKDWFDHSNVYRGDTETSE